MPERNGLQQAGAPATDTQALFAAAPRGTERLLAEELRALGATAVHPRIAGVEFSGDREIAYRACLWSRVASRILLPLARFPAPDGDALYAGARQVTWESHLTCDHTFAVECVASQAAIRHSGYAALRVKDAVVDQLRERTGARPSIDTETPDLRLHLHLRGKTARLSLDLSGGGLHRRGYRAVGARAPLKENLAAALLLLAGWPEVAARGGTLFDPLCGSGTLLTEGALMAADIAPGLLRRHWGFTGWRLHDAPLWEQLCREAEARREEGLARLPPIVGYDRDPEAVAAARENLERAGVAARAVVEQQPLATDRHPVGPGLLITNPPYGERLGEGEPLRRLYAELGRLIGVLPDWRAAVFTGNETLALHLARPASRRDPLYNGPLSCTLYHLPAGSPVPGEGETMFGNRLRKNRKHLGRWARREGVDCFRLYDADLPEYALAVDCYLGERLWLHVQEYAPPKQIDPERARQRLEEAMNMLVRTLEIPSEQIFFKVRQRQKGAAQYEKQAEQGRFHVVQEGGHRFWVNFESYLDTGLFLDHRITRQMIGELARGRNFLNLFAYTGTATVYAAAGGAVTTTTVDLSRTYLEWAERNLALNGLDTPAHERVRADCRVWLQSAERERRRYDLIFLDPPTFSTSKRMEGAFDVQRDHVALIRGAMRLLTRNGILLFSTNFRRFRLDAKKLADFGLEEITRQTLPPDFQRGRPIHRCWLITPSGR